ncbi:MAG TPA: sterol desaturase family protein [Gemmatimonadales bacterium]|nr:sterol desaturase family protein [Gemmatimonadales bacterium]
MFRSSWLEALSHVHPLVPHAIFVPCIALLLFGPGERALRVYSTAGAVVFGLLLWTLVEYVIHRYVFHPPQWIEDDTRRILGTLAIEEPAMPALPTLRHRFYFLVHGVHHDFPNDSRRLVMPPSVSVPLACVFYVAFRAALGEAANPAFAGFVIGYLAYDTIHYLTHHGSRHTTLGRYLRRAHFGHHYVDSSRNFGVSSPLWDVLLGTRARDRT